MPRLQKLPTDISTFSKMIEREYLYVDKTEQIYNLYSSGSNYHFLSRPRRFGKSLLISTLKELFAGNKKLFQDLWIASSDWEWKKYPVVHLDFSTIAHGNPIELRNDLMIVLDDLAKKYGLDLSKYDTSEAKLRNLIEKLSQEKNKVVILIDEYDKPIISHVTNFEIADKNRDILRSFYDVIKGLDEYLHAIFVTGVSKFSKTSIFSGINNLNDISQKSEAATLLGYTQQELEQNLESYIESVAMQQNRSKQAILDEMKEWYNGYRFSEDDCRVYNPFSILYYLKDKKRANYWVRSGTPTFLVNLLKQNYQMLQDFSGVEVTDATFNPIELTNKIPLIPLLYQAGYLTIDSISEEFDLLGKNPKLKYKLDYPNQETREALLEYILVALTFADEGSVGAAVAAIRDALIANDIDAFCRQVRIMLANIPYKLHIKHEHYYHSIFQAMLYLMGVKAESEITTSKGSIDMVIKALRRIFIFELKFDKSPKQALEQIHEKKYYEKFKNIGLPITLAGISFTYKDKELSLDFVQEQM